MLDGNTKMCINTKNVHKNLCTQLSRINFLSDKKKLRWKHIYRINSSKCIKKLTWLCSMGWETWLTSGSISFTASEILFWSFWAKSVIKVFLYNCLKRLCSQTAASTSESNERIYCVSSARSEPQVIYYIWKVLYSVASPSFLSDI